MNYVIETKNLSKKFPNKLAVDKVNIHVQKGDIYGLIGKISGNDFFTWPNLGDKFTIVQYIIPYTLFAFGVIAVIVINFFIQSNIL